MISEADCDEFLEFRESAEQLVALVFEECSMSHQLEWMSAFKAERTRHSVRHKFRLTESGTDLITIERCFLSFKTVVTSRNIIVFKINLSMPKTAIRVVHALWYLVPLAGVNTPSHT